MNIIQQKFRQQNYAIKGVCSKIKKMNIKISLTKQLIILVALLSLNTIIFIFLFNSKKKTGKNLQKIYKRKLEI